MISSSEVFIPKPLNLWEYSLLVFDELFVKKNLFLPSFFNNSIKSAAPSIKWSSIYIVPSMSKRKADLFFNILNNLSSFEYIIYISPVKNKIFMIKGGRIAYPFFNSSCSPAIILVIDQ